jgi:hypothetical protein
MTTVQYLLSQTHPSWMDLLLMPALWCLPKVMELERFQLKALPHLPQMCPSWMDSYFDHKHEIPHI